MVRRSLIFSRIFCGRFHGQKFHQKQASATSHFLTRCDVTEGTGRAISIEIYSQLGEKSRVLERNSENLCGESKPSPVYGTPHYVLAVQESVRPVHGVTQARFYNSPC